MSESINKQAPEPTSATLDITAAISGMLLIRTVEEQLLELFSTGKLAGTTHTSIGQEISAVGVVNALRRIVSIKFNLIQDKYYPTPANLCVIPPILLKYAGCPVDSYF